MKMARKNIHSFLLFKVESPLPEVSLTIVQLHKKMTQRPLILPLHLQRSSILALSCRFYIKLGILLTTICYEGLMCSDSSASYISLPPSKVINTGHLGPHCVF